MGVRNNKKSENTDVENIHKLPGLPGYKTLTIIFIFVLIFDILFPSIFEAHWPYTIILLIFIFLQYFNQTEGIRSSKTLFMFALMLTSIFGMQFLYYLVLPMYGNYHPITNPNQFAGFQMDGKFQINYVPDHPEPGSSLLLYVNICNIGLTNCRKCSKCFLDGYFYDGDKRRLPLFQNKSLDEQGKMEFTFPGKYVEVTVRHEDYHKNIDFIVPQQSFWYTVYLSLIKSPILAFFAGATTVLTLIGTLKIFYSKLSPIQKKLKEFFNNEEIENQ